MFNFYSCLLKNIVLPIADRVMHTNVSSFYHEIKKMQSYSNDEIAEWQFVNLKKLLNHAYNNTNYYRKIFNQANLLPRDITGIQDLNKLPILTKDDIKKNFNDIVPGNISSIIHKKSFTGGSSGVPLTLLLDNKSWSYAVANKIFNWEKIGYKYGEKHIALGSTSLLVNKNKSFKHLFYYILKRKIGLNGINMSNDVCFEYINFIKKRKIRYIYGYASSIFLLAKYLLNTGCRIDIKACFSTSEILTNEYRNTIYDAFKCKIMDCYGAHDGGITAFEYKNDFFEVGYNSVLLLENNFKKSSPVLLTDLFNYAMPLINYKLGDEVEMDYNKNLKYDYNGQIIDKILGRTSDVIYLENGRNLTGPGFTVLFKNLPVEYYYIKKNGINSVECSIVKAIDYNEKYETLIIDTFKKQIGSDATISINYINEPVLADSGKRKYFDS